MREAPAFVRLRERDRNRRGDRIAVAIEIDDDAIEIEAQPLGHRLDDAPVGLMRDQPGEIAVMSLRFRISSVTSAMPMTAALYTAGPSCTT